MFYKQADGIEKEQNTPNLIVHLNEGTQYKTIPINYPPELVPDSSHIQVSLYGKYLFYLYKNSNCHILKSLFGFFIRALF